MKHDRVRKFLAEFVAPSKCLTCTGDPAIAADIAQFADLREKGETTVSWMRFHKRCLLPAGYQFTYAAMMAHVRRCLRGRGL